MKEREVRYWADTIHQCRRFMEKKHSYWKGLLNSYRLEYSGAIPHLEDDQIVKMSRFVPKVRKVIAAIAYNLPQVFLKVDHAPIGTDTQGQRIVLDNASEVLGRAANDALRIMKAKPEIHQFLFDILFKYRGFIKLGYNPAGDDSTVPYVANDYLAEDFPYVLHVPTEKIFVDPLVRASQLSSARFVIEEMMVPLEMAKKDDRFTHRSQMKAFEPVTTQDKDMQMTDTYNIAHGWDEDEREMIAEVMKTGEFVIFHEVHDRLKRRRYVFANDIEQPVEDIDHPLAVRQAEFAQDPISGLQVFQGAPEQETSQEGGAGFLAEGGFPYFTATFDLSDRFWSIPVMGYSNDLQNLMVESLSRSVDIIDRGKTLVVVSSAAEQHDPSILDKIKKADDMEGIVVPDINQDIREIVLGIVPPEQKELEYRAVQYESELLEVGAVDADTATEAAAFMGDAELNRKWFQGAVQGAYEWIVRSSFSVMGDPRYTPEKFLVNVAKEDAEVLEASLESWWLSGRYDIEVAAGSASILVEQLNRNDVLQLAQWLQGNPDIDQRRLVEMVIEAFNVTKAHDLFKDDADVDVVKTVQLEHEMLGLGRPVQVLAGEDHEAHMRLHTKTMQEVQSQLVQPGMPPNPLGAILEQHVALHAQAMQQSGNVSAGAGVGGGGGQADQAPVSISSTIQSNAAKLADAVKVSASPTGSEL